jgi:hypothetical protein
MPERGLSLVPWTKRQVFKLSKAHPVDAGDIWDEAITALLRACVYFKPGAGTFAVYAKRCVTRGLWRYTLPSYAVKQTPGTRKRGAHNGYNLRHVSLDDVKDMSVPSAEEIAIARESARNLRKCLSEQGKAAGMPRTSIPGRISNEN